MSIRKNIGFLIGGTALAQVFTFAISPILTRVYTPESFGVLGIVLAASSIIAVFAHLRLNLAIAQSNNINEAIIILKTSIFFSILLCFLSSIFLIVSNIIFDNSYTLSIVIFIFLISLLNVLIDIFNYWQSYRGKHSLNARNSVARSLLTGSVQIFLGFISNFGLILGVLVGSLGSLTLFLKEYLSSDNKKSNSILSNKKIHFVLKKYKDFPLYSMPQGFIASASLNSVPLMLGASFGVGIAGQYWLAYRILLAPIALFGGAYKQVLHPIFLDPKKNNSYKKYISKKHTIIFLLIFIPLTFLLYFLLPSIFYIIFGDEWGMAAKFSSWLVLCFGMDIAKVPAICLIHAYKRQKEYLKFEIFLSIFRILSMVIGISLFDAYSSIVFFSLISMFFSFILIIYCLTFMKEKDD